MNGFLKDITYARSGEYILSIYTRESCKDIWKNFGERPITFTITKKADPRGLRANSYAWALIEQLAARLYRYAKLKGYDVSASADLSGCSDAAKVNTYAVDAMRWAVAEGLIQGMGGKLNPQSTATRAQVATILMRFLELYSK